MHTAATPARYHGWHRRSVVPPHVISQAVAMPIAPQPLSHRSVLHSIASASIAGVFMLCGLIGLNVGVPAVAGEYNAVLNIGDPAPQWKDLEGVDGQKHHWTDVADARCVVVAFTCNSCPYARDVEDRLIELVKEFPAPDVKVVAINVNVIEEDLLPAMKARTEEKGFTYPYLHDPTQQIAKDYGAIKTPEFFVLTGSGKVAYMGALDDSPDGKAVSKRYVADAIRAVLADEKPQVTETVPIGCRIRFNRSRR